MSVRSPSPAESEAAFPYQPVPLVFLDKDLTPYPKPRLPPSRTASSRSDVPASRGGSIFMSAPSASGSTSFTTPPESSGYSGSLCKARPAQGQRGTKRKAGPSSSALAMAGSSSATTPNATPGILSGSVYPTIASLITRAFEVSGLQNSAQMDILSTPSGRNSRIRCKGGEDTCCFRVGYERYKDGEKKVVTTLVDLGHSTQCKRDATGLFVAPDAPESAASAGNKGKQAEVRRSQPVDSGSEPESLHGMNTENAHDGAAPASPPAAIVRKTIAMINPQARRRAQQLASNAKPSAPVPPPTAGEVFSSLRTLERRIADAHFDGDTDKLLRIVDEETDTVQITCDWEDECTFVYLGKAAAGSEQYYRVQKSVTSHHRLCPNRPAMPRKSSTPRFRTSSESGEDALVSSKLPVTGDWFPDGRAMVKRVKDALGAHEQQKIETVVSGDGRRARVSCKSARLLECPWVFNGRRPVGTGEGMRVTTCITQHSKACAAGGGTSSSARINKPTKSWKQPRSTSSDIIFLEPSAPSRTASATTQENEDDATFHFGHAITSEDPPLPSDEASSTEEEERPTNVRRSGRIRKAAGNTTSGGRQNGKRKRGQKSETSEYEAKPSMTSSKTSTLEPSPDSPRLAQPMSSRGRPAPRRQNVISLLESDSDAAPVKQPNKPRKTLPKPLAPTFSAPLSARQQALRSASLKQTPDAHTGKPHDLDIYIDDDDEDISDDSDDAVVIVAVAPVKPTLPLFALEVLEPLGIKTYAALNRRGILERDLKSLIAYIGEREREEPGLVWETDPLAEFAHSRQIHRAFRKESSGYYLSRMTEEGRAERDS